MINPKEITDLINQVYDIVESSKVGKIITRDDINREIVHHLPFQTFLTVLNSFLPKDITGKFQVDEPKEEWKGDGK